MDGIKIFAVVLACLLISPAVSAQDNEVNSTESEEESVVYQVDDSTAIKSTNWDDGGVYTVFYSRMPRMATITDMNSMPSSGAGEVSFKQVRIGSGTTEVFMPAETRRGDKTVSIGVGDSLIAVSNPTQPLFEDVGRYHVYVIALITAVLTPLQILIRQYLAVYMLKSGLVRN